MAVAETFAFSLNVFLAFELSRGRDAEPTPWYDALFAETFGRLDPGGSMLVHMFGCFFGLAVGMFYRPAKREGSTPDERDEHSDYNSNTFALFGTAVLFALFPSFNAALVVPNMQVIFLFIYSKSSFSFILNLP